MKLVPLLFNMPLNSNLLRINKTKVKKPLYVFDFIRLGDSTIPLATNLVAAWNFESYGSGVFVSAFPVADATYNLRGNGTPASTAGKVGNSSDLTAANTFLDIAAGPPAALKMPDGIYSGCFWIYFNSVLPTQSLDLLHNPTTNSGYILRVAANTGVLTFFSGTGSAYESVVAADEFVENGWYFVAFTRNATSIKVSISSTSAYTNLTSSVSTAFTQGGGTFIINRTTAANYSSACLLDSLFMWNRSLTDVDFQNMWNLGAGRSWPV